MRADSGGRRLSATITWEDSDRPPFDMEFDRVGSAEPLAESIHPFLLGSIVPAWRRRERRLMVEGSVCPRLRDGLRGAIGLLSAWWPSDLATPAIEAAGGFEPYPGRVDRAGVFLTGGVDSLHLLHLNRHFYPPGHPASFRDGVYVRNFSFTVRTAQTADLLERQSRAVADIAGATGLDIVFLGSNSRFLEPEAHLVTPQDEAALLSASIHTITPRLGTISLAASHDAAYLPRWGTNPALDPHYGSSGLEFRHETFGYTRLEKTVAIAEWDVARKHLIVCFEGPLPAGQLNCARCEKCLRTMTALVSAGALDRFEAFGGQPVTPEKIETMSFGHNLAFFDWLWRPMLAPLRARGEMAIARAIERKLGAARRLGRWHAEEDWRGRLRRIDRRWLGGGLLRLTRRLRGLPAPPH